MHIEKIKPIIKKVIPFSISRPPVLKQKEENILARILLEKAEEFKPDIMLVLKGETIRGDIIREIKNRGVLTANWFMDTVISPYSITFVEEISQFYDFFFIVDSIDVTSKIKISSKKVFFLPAGFDRDMFRRIELDEKDRITYGAPVTFVGTVVNNRIPVLEEIADLGLCIWGPDRSVEGVWLKKSPMLSRRFSGRPIYGEEAVKVYNASKIVFSVHSLFPENVYNVTPRIFEVAACKAFHLVDYANQLENFYKLNEEIICYRNIKEIRRLCEYYLSHDEERNNIAERAYKRAWAEHTYDHRIGRLLDIVKKG